MQRVVFITGHRVARARLKSVKRDAVVNEIYKFRVWPPSRDFKGCAMSFECHFVVIKFIRFCRAILHTQSFFFDTLLTLCCFEIRARGNAMIILFLFLIASSHKV